MIVADISSISKWLSLDWLPTALELYRALRQLLRREAHERFDDAARVLDERAQPLARLLIDARDMMELHLVEEYLGTAARMTGDTLGPLTKPETTVRAPLELAARISAHRFDGGAIRHARVALGGVGTKPRRRKK